MEASSSFCLGWDKSPFCRYSIVLGGLWLLGSGCGPSLNIPQAANTSSCSLALGGVGGPYLNLRDVQKREAQRAGQSRLRDLAFGSQSSPFALSSNGCTPLLEKSSWKPSVPQTGDAQHSKTATFSTVTTSATGAVVGYAQSVSASKEVTFSIDMSDDLGAYGSLSLSARMTQVPLDMRVYPLLVYLSDGVNDFINLSRAGVNRDCAMSGYFTASADENPNCKIEWPSAYFDPAHWQQHWLQWAPDAPTVDTFPTCHWSQGSPPPSTDSACAFDTTFFQGGKLAYNRTYTAKYVLLSGEDKAVSGLNATVELTIIKKKAEVAPSAGAAIDLNVILVGNQNINDSRTNEGQANLDLLFSNIRDLFTPNGISLGKINVFEWDCARGGELYANLDTEDIYSMFSAAGEVFPSLTPSLNLFLVNTFTDSSMTLGISGAIGGPFQSGTSSSGVAVATLGQLASFNFGCTSSSCPVTAQDEDFRQLGPTIAHEMGHYLGLNHPSERPRCGNLQEHDIVYDTPICTNQNSSGSISIYSCAKDTHVYASTGQTCPEVCPGYNGGYGRGFCPTELACQFNHLMFRTGKYYVPGSTLSDGNLISPNDAAIIGYHPLVW